MKIVMVVSTLVGRGGAERVVSVLSQYLSQTHQVVVAAFQVGEPSYSYGGDVVEIGFPAARQAWKKGSHALARVAALARLFARERPDRIFSFMESANFPSVIAASLVGMRERVSVCVQDNPAGFPASYRRLIPRLYPLAGRVVAVSEGVRKTLTRDFGLDPARCVTIPNTIDLEAIEAALAATRVGFVPPADQYLLGMGRLVDQKGFDLAIAAYARLSSEAPPLIILGEGPDRTTLEARVEAEGLSGRVRFPGAVANPYPYLAGACCFVLSSRHEGWPLVLMEAMACGCPIISFACDHGPAEILEHGRSGWLVTPGDVEGLASAMERLLGDEALRRELAAGALDRVKRFDVERISRVWLSQDRDSRAPGDQGNRMEEG